MVPSIIKFDDIKARYSAFFVKCVDLTPTGPGVSKLFDNGRTMTIGASIMPNNRNDSTCERSNPNMETAMGMIQRELKQGPLQWSSHKFSSTPTSDRNSRAVKGVL